MLNVCVLNTPSRNRQTRGHYWSCHLFSQCRGQVDNWCESSCGWRLHSAVNREMFYTFVMRLKQAGKADDCTPKYHYTPTHFTPQACTQMKEPGHHISRDIDSLRPRFNFLIVSFYPAIGETRIASKVRPLKQGRALLKKSNQR